MGPIRHEEVPLAAIRKDEWSAVSRPVKQGERRTRLEDWIRGSVSGPNKLGRRLQAGVTKNGLHGESSAHDA